MPALSALCRMACLPEEPLSPEELEHGIFNDPCHDPKWSLAAWEDGEMIAALNGALRPAKDQPAGLVKLFAVHPSHRRQGVASALFDRFEALCADAGAATVRVGAIGPLYFFSGVDPRYTEAVLLLLQRGYGKTGDGFYMAVDLDRPLPQHRDAEEALARDGITFDRPPHEQMEPVREWVRSVFGDGWAHETKLGFGHDPVGVWVARASGELCGFGASNATGRQYFGPIGVSEAYRGRGIGRILVVKCLSDLQRDGRAYAWIPTGLGRIAFYHQAAGAKVERVFWSFAKTLQA